MTITIFAVVAIPGDVCIENLRLSGEGHQLRKQVHVHRVVRVGACPNGLQDVELRCRDQVREIVCSLSSGLLLRPRLERKPVGKLVRAAGELENQAVLLGEVLADPLLDDGGVQGNLRLIRRRLDDEEEEKHEDEREEKFDECGERIPNAFFDRRQVVKPILQIPTGSDDWDALNGVLSV
jgi:hypothetical protein